VLMLRRAAHTVIKFCPPRKRPPT